MAATGLRVSETCALAAGRHRPCHAAGHRPLTARATRPGWCASTPPPAKFLDRYLRVRARHRHGRRDAICWIGHRGPLTRKGIPAILDKRTAMAGIGHVHAHQLRHTWAHRWLTERRRRTGHDAPRRVGQPRSHAPATGPRRPPTGPSPPTTTSTRWGSCEKETLPSRCSAVPEVGAVGRWSGRLWWTPEPEPLLLEHVGDRAVPAAAEPANCAAGADRLRQLRRQQGPPAVARPIPVAPQAVRRLRAHRQASRRSPCRLAPCASVVLDIGTPAGLAAKPHPMCV